MLQQSPQKNDAGRQTFADSDGGGIDDGRESERGSDPTDVSDDFPDTDEDGVTDDVEALLGTDPAVTDTDGDGLSDGDEVNRYLSDPLLDDSDGDGLSDGDEINVYGLNALNPDTDGDGASDGVEIELGSSPYSKYELPSGSYDGGCDQSALAPSWWAAMGAVLGLSRRRRRS